MKEKTIALIGLDTSHTVEFTKLMQDPQHKIADGMRATKAFRFPSAFQSEEGQDKRQAELERLGVRMAGSIEEAVDGVDAIFLEINDPALHLPFFEKVVGLGKPVFVDKPLAATVKEGRRMRELAESTGTVAWSSSSLRFIPGLAEAKKKVSRPFLVRTFGPLGKAARGSDLVWYGVHAVEMLVVGLGVGARAVRGFDDGVGVIIMVEYGDQSRGLVECVRGFGKYGGRLQSRDEVACFDAGSGSPYAGLMAALRDFVITGVAPVSWDETLEVLGILEAAELSLAKGGSRVGVEV